MRLPRDLVSQLHSQTGPWLVSGVAGFIGSNLLQALLEHDQTVRGLDNFATGHQRNLDQVRAVVRPEQWARFEFCQGDIRDESICRKACADVRYVLHQAALGSVPGSIADPAGAHATNVTGTLHMLLAGRDAGVERFVYASSCAVYGDSGPQPLREDHAAPALSPYAANKQVNEMYASVSHRCYGLPVVGLRYFNVFGPRQDPHGPYAAVLPRWVAALLRGDQVTIYGDGETSRDFCYVANIVQANLRAALISRPEALNRVYNVAMGQDVTLNQLFLLLRDRLAGEQPRVKKIQPLYREFRPGDIRRSRADLSQANRVLGYEPHYDLEQGLEEALAWYRANLL